MLAVELATSAPWTVRGRYVENEAYGPQMTTMSDPQRPIRVCLLALPESSGSGLYGLFDVLGSVGRTWPGLTGEPATHPGFDLRIVSISREPFRCHGGVPVAPDAALAETPSADVVVISDLEIDINTDPRGRWPEAAAWVAAQHEQGALICTVCTGSVLLADTGLLDGREATTHWAARTLFQTCYPAVRLRPERVLIAAGPDQHLITSGGAASWQDLSLHLIHRFCGREETTRTAKIFLLGDRSDGQLPYAAMIRPHQHEDALIQDCQIWIADNYAVSSPVSRLIARSGLPERTFKRRFRAATGYAPVTYVQTLRIEEAKQQLETTAVPTDVIGASVGYEDAAFFRRLFKRQTGVTPARYRQRFRSIGELQTRGKLAGAS
jgi:transcriptional regulator GlxA family with amidase domain